ncbi:DUF2486 family protein [Pararobbsia alpina]|uniref:DUF2486 family protein n=1 Tax=Pararobbsia alpina TaxID=621374 RepID=UPI0039A5FD05
MRDDDLSIPVLADILEPGDPAKADPAVPRRPVDHAWTDALQLDSHAERLGALPVLSDVLVEGEGAHALASPRPADAALTIPLLTDVLPYHDAVGGLSSVHHEPGASIPLLTDVFPDSVAESAAHDEADIPTLTEFVHHEDDIPTLMDVAHDEADIPVLTEAVHHEDDIPTLMDVAHDEADIPVLTEAVHHEDDIPTLTDVAHDEADIPVLTEAVHREDDIPTLTDVAHDEADIPTLTEAVHHEEDIPTLTDVAHDEADIPVLTEAVHHEDDIPTLTDAARDEADIPVLTELAEIPHEIPAAHDLSVPPLFEEPVFEQHASEHHAFDEPAFEGHLYEEPVFEEHADAEALAASAHTAADLHAVASPVDAHLFDPELPFRAYCSFPGEKAVEPLASGLSDVPDTYPMAHVPQPFGSAQEQVPVPQVTEAQVTDGPGVSVHAVPFEPIAVETLPELSALEFPDAANAAELDPRDFGDHEPHRLIAASEPTLEATPQTPDLRDFGQPRDLPADVQAVEPVEPEELESVYSEPPFTTSEAPEAAHESVIEAKAEPVAESVAESIAHPAVDSTQALPHESIAEPDAHAVRPLDLTQTAEPAFAQLKWVDQDEAEASSVANAETETEAVAQTAEPAHGAVMAEEEADHVAAMLSRHEPVAAELTMPEPPVSEPVARRVEPEAAEPQPVEPVSEQADVAHDTEPSHGAVMADEEADHVAAILSRHEPVAAELTLPEPEPLAAATAAPTPADLERVATVVGERALKYLSGEGHSLIEERCQEQAVWLAHRITREIAASLEREIGQWVQQAIKEAVDRRDPTQ